MVVPQLAVLEPPDARLVDLRVGDVVPDKAAVGIQHVCKQLFAWSFLLLMLSINADWFRRCRSSISWAKR